jgi:hypothetical protein
MKLSFLPVLTLLLCIGCSDEQKIINQQYEIQQPKNPLPKGNRKFNIAPSDGINGFASTFNAMQEVGVNLVEINLEWAYFEEQKGVYQDPLGLLQAVGFYGQNNIHIAISLATINTVKRTDPSYLNANHYDDEEYIDAFNKLIDWMMGEIPEEVTVDYISLGNEVDLVLNGEDWTRFKSFMIAASDHIHQQYPDVKTGAKVTVTGGLLGSDTEHVLDLISVSDAAMLNYYPSDNYFKVLDIHEIQGQLDMVLSKVDKEIYLTELGFQSGSEHCQSSEEKQARFYHYFFEWWDDHAGQVTFVQINWLHDISSTTLDEYEDYYGFSDKAFLEYLATLGIKNHDETPKLGWEQIKADAHARGWKK